MLPFNDHLGVYQLLHGPVPPLCFLYVLQYDLHWNQLYPDLQQLHGKHELSPSMVSNSRRNYAILCSVIIPFGWVLSYFFLWIYFKLDNGFSSETNMRFKYEENETGENISDSWEDLNDVQFIQ